MILINRNSAGVPIWEHSKKPSREKNLVIEYILKNHFIYILFYYIYILKNHFIEKERYEQKFKLKKNSTGRPWGTPKN